MIYLMSQAEADQTRKVNAAYSKTGSVNPEYEREFDILSDMRRASMAAKFANLAGCHPTVKPRMTAPQTRNLPNREPPRYEHQSVNTSHRIHACV